MNYTRSLWFNYLPYYHFGFRTNYNLNSKASIQYWLVNGENESEDFNAFKSQAFLLILKPTKALTWNATYYVGQEAHAVAPATPMAAAYRWPHAHFLRHVSFRTGLPLIPSGAAPSKATTQSTGTARTARPIASMVARRICNIRRLPNSPPLRALSSCRIAPDSTAASRKRSRNSRSPEPARSSRDSRPNSEIPARFFERPLFQKLDTVGILKRNQDTALLGLIWWFGGKTGSW